MRRGPALLLVGVLIVAGAVAGARLSAAPFAAVPAAPAASVLTDATSQAWYCGIGTSTRPGQADASVVLVNSGAAVLRGTVQVFGNSSGASGAGSSPGGAPPGPAGQAIALGPHSRGTLRLADALSSGPGASSSFVAAEVVFDGPGGAAEIQVNGPLGVAAVPCAGAPAPQWYFAAGTTKQGASLVLGLFNPFPEDAIADLSFADESGYSAPAEFQGIYVPGRSLVAVDLGSHVVEQSEIATAVSVRVGRLVASELQLDTIPGQGGLSVVTGATSTASTWYLPDGVVQPGVKEQLHLSNPTTSAARVEVTPHLAQGQAAPFDVSLPPRSEQVLDLSGQPRLPAGDDFSLVVSSDSPVVAELTVQSAAPAPRTGSARMLAAAQPARRWLVAVGGATSTQDEFVTVLNVTARPVRVSIDYLDAGSEQPLPGAGRLTVPPGGSSHVRVGQYLSLADLSLLVRSDGPVVVERDLFQVGGPGLGLAIAIPVT